MLYFTLFSFTFYSRLFQTKLTYGMICYQAGAQLITGVIDAFQTKLTYGMICYKFDIKCVRPMPIMFQTKLTYGMICYK